MPEKSKNLEENRECTASKAVNVDFDSYSVEKKEEFQHMCSDNEQSMSSFYIDTVIEMTGTERLNQIMKEQNSSRPELERYKKDGLNGTMKPMTTKNQITSITTLWPHSYHPMKKKMH